MEPNPGLDRLTPNLEIVTAVHYALTWKENSCDCNLPICQWSGTETQWSGHPLGELFWTRRHHLNIFIATPGLLWLNTASGPNRSINSHLSYNMELNSRQTRNRQRMKKFVLRKKIQTNSSRKLFYFDLCLNSLHNLCPDKRIFNNQIEPLFVEIVSSKLKQNPVLISKSYLYCFALHAAGKISCNNFAWVEEMAFRLKDDFNLRTRTIRECLLTIYKNHPYIERFSLLNNRISPCCVARVFPENDIIMYLTLDVIFWNSKRKTYKCNKCKMHSYYNEYFRKWVVASPTRILF